MRKNEVLTLVCIILFFLIERLLLDENADFTRFLEFQLVLIWGLSMYNGYKKFGLFSLYNLCLVGMFIFSIGAIFHFLVSGEDIRYLERGFGTFKFSYRTIQEALWAYSVFILLSFYTYLALYKKNIRTLMEVSLKYKESYLRIGEFLMWSFLVIQIYKGYLYFTAFNANRVEIFLLGNMANPVPTWVRFVASFFEYGYYFILASVPEEKVFKKYSLLYFVVLIPEIALGNRGMFGAFILFYLWYYYKFYKRLPIKTRTAVIFAVFMLVVFQLMEFVRDGGEKGLESISLTRFLVGQGVSFYILPIYIDFCDSMQYYLYPFFLYNILSGFTGYTGQSIEVLQHNCGVGHQLMYAVDSDYYLAGASFGSSSITEIYDAGIIGFLFLSIFFSVMIIFLEKRICSNRFFCFSCLMIVSQFVLSSRGSYFPSLYGFVKLYLFYKFILFMMSKYANRVSH